MTASLTTSLRGRLLTDQCLLTLTAEGHTERSVFNRTDCLMVAF